VTVKPVANVLAVLLSEFEEIVKDGSPKITAKSNVAVAEPAAFVPVIV
jgi:hypothetical protein